MKMLNLGQSHVHGTGDYKSTQSEIESAFKTDEIAEVKESYRGGLTKAMAEVAAEADSSPAWPSYTYKTMTDKTVSGEQSPELGLLGIIENLTVNHNLEADDGAFEEGPGKILPKLIDVQISFAAIHEHVVGWQEDSSCEGASRFAVGAFPYSVDMEGSLATPQAGRCSAQEASGPATDPTVDSKGNLPPPEEAVAGAAESEDPGATALADNWLAIDLAALPHFQGWNITDNASAAYDLGLSTEHAQTRQALNALAFGSTDFGDLGPFIGEWDPTLE